jgi:hypothetical protein
MVINFSLHPTLGEGVYAHVFHIDDRAYKLFLAYPSHHTEEKRRSTFQSQCEAYRRAGSDPDLRKHVATFYGTCVIEDVIDKDGQSIKYNYMPDCCYVLEVLNGSHAKVLAVRDDYSHVRDAYFAFQNEGFSLADADIFNCDDAERFKFVDFA